MADADPVRPATVPLRTIDLVRDRTVEAVLGQSALNHPALAAEIRRRFGGTDVAQGALVREPVIEGAAPFMSSGRTFADCAGNPLHPDVIRAISSDRAGEYRFPPDAQPYKHQIEAWAHLTAAERRSVLVSSGTGSGKTECFLMPLLHNLATESDIVGRLSGVRAIMLYPLNALIASQKERLSAWTAPFGERIRFGLYNGMTPEKLRTQDKTHPEQAEDRLTLRNDPPPILVTNVTMLEYMTVRRIDRPLIDKSQGQLRWIILDEAHGYVGSAAAEVALLLRRVLLAFGVRAQDVRFVATSATIGERRDVTDELRRFLRDLSGADERVVQVVLGARDTIDLPAPAGSPVVTPAMLADRDAMAASPPVQTFIRAAQAGPLGLDKAEMILRPTGQPADALIAAIADAHDVQRGPLLPLRVHGFLRAVPGLWSCINADCKNVPDGWPFGAILPERADECPHCQAMVLEVVNCRECGEPYLDCEEREGRLQQRIPVREADEFAALREREPSEPDDDDETDGPATDYDAERLSIATRPVERSRPAHVKPGTGQRCDAAQDGTRAYFILTTGHCGACGADSGKAGDILWPLRFGAPFLIGNAAPILLEGVAPRIDPKASHRPPANGRQLLSFTDSRQGTARFAANLQNTAERGFVRGYIYHAVQGSMVSSGEDDPAAAELRAEIAKLEGLGIPDLAEMVAGKKVQLAAMLRPKVDGLAWSKLRADLAQQDEVCKWMVDVWALRDTRYTQSEAFAQFLLLRELARRPRRANTIETMGLARLRFAAIDCIHDIPTLLRARGLGVEAWQGLLYAIIDMTVRANLALRASDEDLHWITAKGWRKEIKPFGEKGMVGKEVNWPSAGAGGNSSNIVLLLQKALNLDRSDPEQRRDLNEVLEAAWDRLSSLFSSPTQAGLALDLDQARIAPVIDAWRCPVSRRVLPTLPLGLSPYGHREGLLTSSIAPQPISLPHLPFTFPRGNDVERLRDWLVQDQKVIALREAGMWTNLHDRAALQSPYLRAAEHSAQQPPARLRRFEAAFKAGAINILNCSTTMEMGVDIGSVSAVMMTNVPPALANYRQRVGRAGRRGQGFATSLTYTRDTPLDREMFRDPQKYLRRENRAPQVKLDSRRIVQRHVNALLLARWFAGEGGEALKTRVGAYFGCPEGVGAKRPDHAPVDAFRAWVAQPSTVLALGEEVRRLTAGTALAGDGTLFDATRDALENAHAAIVQERETMQAQAADAPKEGKNAIGFQLQRLANDNLLSELSVRAVLPGHGFPTNVVPFVASDKPLADEAAGDDRSARRRSHPTRNLDIAIRDYAPGAEVVVDGLVYRSAGVTLNWQRPVDADKVREVQSIQTFWACPTCGAADCASVPPQHCPACHAILPTDDSAQRRFLEPSGFTADMGAKPHAETDMVTYVEPEAEQIVARGAAWLPFADPAQGRMRFSHDGLVFYSSRGATRKGYDVCLECGRAEAATDGMDRLLKDHKPLRHSRADAAGLCPGNDLSFKILYGIALGHQTLTDVAELQPVGLEEDGVAWALLSALRQALARRLGVETGELGMAVRPAWTPIGQKTHSLYLFDRASGGAGFAPQAVPLYDRLLRDAVAILDCHEPGCVRGCSACVLTGDLYRQQDRIDRTGALAWAKSALAALGTVASDDAIAADAQLCRSVADDLVAMLDQGARTLTIWTEGDTDVAALGEGALSLVARRAADRGVALHLVIDPLWIGMLDPAARLALRDFAKTRTIILRQGTAPRFANDAIGIAAADGGQPSIWASRDKQAARPGPYWGLGQDAPVVRAPAGRMPLSAMMDLDSLLPVSGTQFIELGQDLDGPIADFGRKLVDALLPAIRAAGGTDVLARIDYNDRYLQSPLVIRLMAEAMAALRDALAESGNAMDVRLITNRFKRNERQPFAPDHDWQWEEDRADVLEAVLAAKALTATLVEQGAAHGRVMTLSFVGGAVVRLVLDQGFGPWRTPSYAKFDFGVDAQRQADRLMAYSALIAARGGGYVVVTA